MVHGGQLSEGCRCCAVGCCAGLDKRQGKSDVGVGVWVLARGGRLLSVAPGCIGVWWCVCWLGCGMVGVEDS